MSWKTISLCLCIYGILKDFRPSEPYVISFLEGPRMNFNEEQINNEILPISIYASMIAMIIVSITTDWLRYKIVIVIQALCGVSIYILLSFCTSFTSVIASQILYGFFAATDVAYFTYIYSVVDIKYYQKVTSYIRVAHLLGHFFSAVLAQVFISTKLLDEYQLNFLTLGSLASATCWTFMLPTTKKMKYKLQTQEMNTITENMLEQKNDESVEKTIENSKMSWEYIGPLFKEYKNWYVLKLSFWVIIATGCFNQVIFYIQSLWESLDYDECINSVCPTTEWNGAIDALYTVISTVVTILCGSIKLDMNKYVCVIIIVISFIQSVALYTSAVCNSVYISYVNYIVFSTIYQGMMTIVSSEIAKFVNKDKHGFVFGVNNLLAAVLQSLATFFMNIGGLSSSKILFEWYAGFCLIIGICYLFIAIGQIIKK